MKTPILLFTMGGTEWLLIALVVLLLFGGKKIPELMRGLGRGMKEFRMPRKTTMTFQKKKIINIFKYCSIENFLIISRNITSVKK